MTAQTPQPTNGPTISPTTTTKPTNHTGSLCATLVLMCSVEKIVISGGVLNRKILYGKIQVRLRFFFRFPVVFPLPPMPFVCVIVYIVIDCGRDGRVLLFFFTNPI